MALYLTLCHAVRTSLGAARARGTSSLVEGGGTCQARGARPAHPPCVPAPRPAHPPCVPAPRPAHPPCVPVPQPPGRVRLAHPPCVPAPKPPGRARPAYPPCVPAPQPPGRVRPAHPPCVPAPEPPSRAHQPPVSRGCAPPQDARPPCPRPPLALPLTCRDAVHQNCVSSSHACLHHSHSPRDQPSGHGCEQDPVALRLQIARIARRADYEREVACRAAAPPAPPACPAPYALGGERECARATDGCTYAKLHERCAHAPTDHNTNAPPARCGPGRTPPPPDACRIRGDVHLDPCAHRRRVMIEIDRSTCTTSASPPPACPQTSSSSCANTASTQVASSSAPPRYRRPTIAERLRGRPPDCQSERHTHTSMTVPIAAKSLSSVAGGLEGMIRSKEHLKEAGLGRVVTDAAAGPASLGKPPDGRLELCVPPGTERVAVQVSMTPAAGGSPASCADASCPPTNVLSFVNFKKPAPCGPAAPPCAPFAPTRCKPGPKTTTKRCSSTSAFMANTIVVNS